MLLPHDWIFNLSHYYASDFERIFGIMRSAVSGLSNPGTFETKLYYHCEAAGKADYTHTNTHYRYPRADPKMHEHPMFLVDGWEGLYYIMDIHGDGAQWNE